MRSYKHGPDFRALLIPCNSFKYEFLLFRSMGGSGSVSSKALVWKHHLTSQRCWSGILGLTNFAQMTGLCLRSLMFTPSLESQHLGLIFNTLQKISSLPSYRQFKIWSQTSPVQFGTVLTDFSWKVCVSDTHHATHAHINHESLINSKVDSLGKS